MLLIIGIGNTNIGLLKPISGNAEFALGVSGITLPATQLIKDAFDLVGVGFLERFTGLAETFAPDFHSANTVASDSAFFSRTAEFAATQEVPALIDVELVPAFRGVCAPARLYAR